MIVNVVIPGCSRISDELCVWKCGIELVQLHSDFINMMCDSFQLPVPEPVKEEIEEEEDKDSEAKKEVKISLILTRSLSYLSSLGFQFQ